MENCKCKLVYTKETEPIELDLPKTLDLSYKFLCCFSDGCECEYSCFFPFNNLIYLGDYNINSGQFVKRWVR